MIYFFWFCFFAVWIVLGIVLSKCVVDSEPSPSPSPPSHYDEEDEGMVYIENIKLCTNNKCNRGKVLSPDGDSAVVDCPVCNGKGWLNG